MKTATPSIVSKWEETKTPIRICLGKFGFNDLDQLSEPSRKKKLVFETNPMPIPKFVPFGDEKVAQRIGVAKGKLTSPTDLDQHNDEVASLFGNEP